MDRFVKPKLIDVGIWLTFAILYFLILMFGFYLYLNLSTYPTYGNNWYAYQELGFWKFSVAYLNFAREGFQKDYINYCAVPNLIIVGSTLTLIKGCFFTK